MLTDKRSAAHARADALPAENILFFLLPSLKVHSIFAGEKRIARHGDIFDVARSPTWPMKE